MWSNLVDFARRSWPEKFDVSSGRHDKGLDVLSVERDDLVAVDRKKGQCCVDDIGHPGSAEQLTRKAAQLLVERLYLYTPQRRRQAGMARTSPPHLADHTAMGHGQL